jgi:uncharacterized protein DUF6048
MKQLLKYLISSLCLLLPWASLAQDSLVADNSKVALLLNVDYGKGIESVFRKQAKWEVGAGVLIARKFYFVVEYGYGKLNPESVINNGSYTSEGNYFRFGLEYVFTLKPKRYLSTGILYAQSDYGDIGNVLIESDLWNNLDVLFIRDGFTSNWIEWIVNTEAPILKVEDGFLSNFYWGTRFRLRMLSSETIQPNFDIFAIPGYGKTYSSIVPAVNFFIKYRLDF